eukprot:1665890-Rhodomonas_salina.2
MEEALAKKIATLADVRGKSAMPEDNSICAEEKIEGREEQEKDSKNGREEQEKGSKSGRDEHEKGSKSGRQEHEKSSQTGEEDDLEEQTDRHTEVENGRGKEETSDRDGEREGGTGAQVGEVLEEASARRRDGEREEEGEPARARKSKAARRVNFEGLDDEHTQRKSTSLLEVMDPRERGPDGEGVAASDQEGVVALHTVHTVHTDQYERHVVEWPEDATVSDR